tara:strand:- start:329 stop:2956 length:2628 start_codon:yes stop_codon:yes gene_type:complete
MVNEEYDSDVSEENPSVDPDTGDEIVDSTDKPVHDDVVVDPDAPILDPGKPVVDEEDEDDPTVDEPGITTRSSNISVSVKEGRDKNISIKKTYNTVSCPCSSYAVLDSNGAIICEKLDFGVKRTVRTIVLKNHYINGKTPRVGDKWRCLKDCKQDNFRWNTYHVVKVEENKSEVSSSLVNSIPSTSNCYIPPTTLKDYKNETIDEKINALTSHEFQNYISNFEEINKKLQEENVKIVEAIEGVHDEHCASCNAEGGGSPELREKGWDLKNPITYIEDKPLYESLDQIYYYNRLFDSSENYNKYTYYKDNKYEGYIPGIELKDEEFISSIMVNNKEILIDHYVAAVSSNNCISKTVSDSPYDTDNVVMGSSGGNVKILVKGNGNPVFTVSLDDSSNCTVLNKRLKNIKLNDTFELNQKIPALPKGLSSETYTLTITPSTDVKYFIGRDFVKAIGSIKMKIYQFAKSTTTLSATSSTISNTTHTGSAYTRSTEATEASTDVTFSGEMSQVANTDQTHLINVKRSSGTDNYYIKDKIPTIEDVISYDTVVKKKVIKDEVDGKVLDRVSEITVVDDFTTDGATVSNRGDVEKGMQFDFAIEKTKTVRKSIDLEEHLKEPCDDCDDELNILTNRFELDNTNDLFEEMYVEGVDYKGNSFINNIISIDCSKTITLEDEVILNKDTELTFKYLQNGRVICATKSSKGEKIKLSKWIVIPRNTTINFENPIKPKLEGYIKYDRSGDNGVNGITISTVITKIKFGQKNTVITIDTDSLVTNKPNACDQYLTVAKGQETYIDFSKCDIDTNKYSKTVTITKQPRGGKVENATYQKFVGDGYVAERVTYMMKYTPNSNFKGKDTIKYTTSDGVNSSDEKTIYLTVK